MALSLSISGKVVLLSLLLTLAARGDPATQPATRVADLDLSSLSAAAATHWTTRTTSDPAIIRAQYRAANPAEVHALDVWVDCMAASAEFDRAILEKFGDAARAPDAILGPEPKRPNLEAIQWQTEGNVAVPVNPPAEADERQMLLENGKWLQPVSVWFCTDDRRLAETAKRTQMLQTLTAGIRAGKYKDLAELSGAWQKASAAGPPEFMMIPPEELPDTNDTTPIGALAAMAMDIANRNGRQTADHFAWADENEHDFARAVTEWIDADIALNTALSKKFGSAPVEDFWKASGVNAPTLLAYAILLRINEAQVTNGADASHATVGVPGALVWEMRKSGNRWRISASDSIADLGLIDGGKAKIAIKDLATFAASSRRVAEMEASIARDVSSGKIVSLAGVTEVFQRDAAAQSAQRQHPATQP